ncbi:MAG: DUF6443 domain-containing protein [Bacteroidota bacterium]
MKDIKIFKGLVLCLFWLLASYQSYAQITGPSYVCPGQSNVQYSLNLPSGGIGPSPIGGLGGGGLGGPGGIGAGSYSWSLTGAMYLFPNNPNVTINFGSNWSGPLTLRVDYNDGSRTTTYTKTIYLYNPGTVSVNKTQVCYGGSVQLSHGGTTGFGFTWQKKVGSGPWTTATSAYPNPYTASNITGTTSFRIRQSNSCGSSYSNTVTVNAYSNLNPGSINGAKTICYNTSAGTLGNSASASGGSGSRKYQWQRKVGSGSWTNISGATSTSYGPGNLTATTDFRRRVTDNNGCGTKYTNTIKVTVRANLSAGSISGAKTICYNGSAGTLGNNTSASGGSGSYKYQWQKKVGSGSWTNVSGATATTYAPGNLTSTTDFRRKVTDNNGCGTKYTSSVRVTVRGNFSSGSINGAKTICYNASAGTLGNSASASGGSGNRTYQWQKKVGSGSWGNISGATSTSYSPGNLTTTTDFRRRVIDNSGCGTKYTNTVRVTVRANVNPGGITGTKTICYNASAGTLGNAYSPSGGTGSFTYLWQRKVGSGSWSDISGATSSTYAPGNLTTTTEFRRKVINSCGVKYTGGVRITVRSNLSAGSINGAKTVCYNASTGTLGNSASASGGSGSYAYRWQKKVGSGSWADISGATATTYSPGNLTSTTDFRRKVTDNNGCGTKYTSSVRVTVRGNFLAGSINGAKTVCYNASAGTLGNSASASGGSGNRTYQWQKKVGSGSWGNISGATSTNYSPGNLTATTDFRRRVIDNSGCGTKYTNNVRVTVRANLSAGGINGSKTICYNTSAGTLGNASSPTGGTGSFTYLWQRKVGSGSWSDISGATSSTYAPGNLTATTDFRRKVSNSCGVRYTSNVRVTVRSNLNAGGINGARTVCYNASAGTLGNSASALGGSGSYAYRWQKKVGSGSWTDISGATATTYLPGNLTSTTDFRRKVTDNNGCGVRYTGSVRITVRGNLTAGSINGSKSICYNASAGTLGNSSSPSGGSGSYAYQWQRRIGSGSWSTILGATSSSYSPGNLTSTTDFRRRVIDNNSCGDRYSNVVKVTVRATLNAGSINGTKTICYNASAGTLGNSASASGGSGSHAYQWQKKVGSGAWSKISGASSTSYSPGNLTASTSFRRRVVDNNGCGTNYTNTITVTVENPGAPTSVTNDYRFGSGVVNLSVSGGLGSYQWFTSSSATTPTHTGGSYAPSISTNKTYYVRRLSANNCLSNGFATATGYVYPYVEISPINDPLLTVGQRRTLQTVASYPAYQWKQDGVNISGANSATYTASVSGSYTVLVTLPNGRTDESDPVILTSLSNKPVADMGPSLDNNQPTDPTIGVVNYVRTYDARVATTNTSHFEINNFNKDRVSVSTQYIAGLGLPVQTTAKSASPVGKDIVQPIIYDQFARNEKEYLPYTTNSATNAVGFRNGALTEQYDFYRFPEADIAATGVPYIQKGFETSPLNRMLKEAAQGESWKMGSGHEIEMTSRTNSSTLDGNIILWTINSDGHLVKEGHYNDGNLIVMSVKNEHDVETIEYKDFIGNIILKRIKEEDDTWSETYYAYDDRNNLTCVLPPQLMAEIPTDFVWSNVNHRSLLQSWAFQYRYDDRQRIVKKTVPGMDGAVAMVYDHLDRIVLSQDPVQHENGEWLFTKYDELNRPILTGIYRSNDNRATLQAEVDDHYAGNDPMFEVRSTDVHGYSNESFPLVSNEEDYLTVTYYDSYELPFDFDQLTFTAVLGHSDYFYRTFGNEHRIEGQVVAGKIRNLIDGDWYRTMNFYDDRYRIIQTIAQNQQGGTDRLSSQYDFIGNLIRTLTEHSGLEQVSILKEFEYDHQNRLLQVSHQTNDQSKVIIAQYRYNELGEQVERNLHSGNQGQNFMQSVDYRYNIRGWMTHINDADLSSAEGDLFGMELYYNHGFEQLQFNGNIAGVKWKNVTQEESKAYGYLYDNLNRITLADYVEKNDLGHWSAGVGNYQLLMKGYDKNGNILGLQRRGLTGPTLETFGIIDDLTYDYTDTGNRLRSVTDVGSLTEGFKDGNKIGDDYTYDVNGNITADKNKGIANITYNLLNLPQVVTKDDGASIRYYYDAAGIKLTQEVYDASNTLTKRTDYVGELIYENDTLKIIQHEEGRVLADPTQDFEYQYNITDHLGNVRLTFTSVPQTTEYLATMESENSTEEGALFTNLINTRVTFLGASHSPNEVSRLNANQPVGPAISLKVGAGDTLEIETYAYYEGGNGYGNTISASSMISAVASAFGGMIGGSETQQAIFDGISQALSGAGALAGTNDDEVPAAYLNYLLFDEHMNFVDAGFRKMSGAAEFSQERIRFNPIVTTKAGFVYVYVSNESQTFNWTYFDDLKVVHKASAVVQADDYYPFGSTFNSYQRTNGTVNDFLYNGFEIQDELDFGLYDYLARFYDPLLGRFVNIDPATDLMRRHSPYSYAFNNPIRFIDPDGMMPHDMSNQKPPFAHTIGRGSKIAKNSFGISGIELNGAGHFGNRSFLNYSNNFSVSQTSSLKTKLWHTTLLRVMFTLKGQPNLRESISQTSTTVSGSFNEDMTSVEITTVTETVTATMEYFSATGENEITKEVTTSVQSYDIKLNEETGLYELISPQGEKSTDTTVSTLDRSEISREFDIAIEVADALNKKDGATIINNTFKEINKAGEEITKQVIESASDN